MASITLKDICKRIEISRGKYFLLDQINLEIPDGQTAVLLGPSGSGKSTLMRIVAGLTIQDAGVVRYGTRAMGNVPVRQRQIGMVFQNFVLYPHISPLENMVARFFFGRQTPHLKEVSQQKLKRSAELLNIDPALLVGKRISKLSTGERQRVALGRAITRDPDVLLFDEPLSNLDEKLRVMYRPRLKHLLSELKITTLYITHDQREAAAIGDFVIVMNQGRIEQRGTYQEIYDHPDNLFVASFLSLYSDLPAINILEGAVLSPQYEDSILGVRPEDIEISLKGVEKPAIPALVQGRLHNPARTNDVLELTVGKQIVRAICPGDLQVKTGETVWLRFKKFHDFEKKSGQRRTVSESLRNTLSLYLSPEVAEKVVYQPGSTLLQAERKKVTVMFCDFRSFTTFSEEHSPEVVIETLNEYLKIVLGEIRLRRGVVNKFIGDAVMAVWGMSYEQADDADQAFQAACQILARLNLYNQQRIAAGLPTLNLGAGLHTGYAVAGNVGDLERKEYTVIGDVVNTAQRIEGVNKDLGTSLLVSEETFQALSDASGLTWLKKVKLKGKSQEVGLYTLKVPDA